MSAEITAEASTETLSADAPAPRKEPRIRHIPKLRRDLEVIKQRYERLPFAVIKDPISLVYFRVPWRDYHLMKIMEGCRNGPDVVRKWKREVPELALEMSDALLLKKVAMLIRDFESRKLCEMSATTLLKNRARRQDRKTIGRRVAWMVSWLIIRKSLYDPDPLLARITPKLWFLFRPWFSIGALLFILSAGWTLITHLSEVHFDKDWFLAPGNLGLLFVSVILLKIVHEFGHGVTCKHFGGEVHEIGFMIMILTPMFYVNTSDAWLFPNKKHRIYVSAAGVYVEMIFAAALVYVWLVLAQGFWKQFTFSAVIAASFTTLLFNANPLMRFDGYYAMSDWLEIPNLRQKSRAFLGRQFRKLFFGKAYPEVGARVVPGRDSTTFAIYSLLSFGYLLFLMSHVFRRLHLLDKFGLSLLAYLLVSLWAIAAIIWPITRFFGTPYKNAARYKIQLSLMNRYRPLIVFLGLVLAVVIILNLPFPKTVVRSCALELADADMVRAAQPGFVSEVLAKEGDMVQKGQVLARLRSPDLQTKLVTQRESLRQADSALNQAISENDAQKFKVATHQREEAVADLKDTESKVSDLSMAADSDGRVLTRNLDDKLGRYLAAGEPLCIVGPSSDFDILVPLTEQEARFVKRGAAVVLKVTALPEITFHGEVTQEPLSTLGNALPASLTARRGGDVDTTIDKAGKEKPLEHQWYAQVKIEESSHLLRPGMTGRVKVKCGIQTVGRVLGQKLLDSINLDYRL